METAILLSDDNEMVDKLRYLTSWELYHTGLSMNKTVPTRQNA